MKILLILALLSSPLFASEKKTKMQKISDKVQKRKGYCSPLDKMMKNCEAKDGETDKEIINKAQRKAKKVSKKIEKRKSYCSPLQKATGKCEE